MNPTLADAHIRWMIRADLPAVLRIEQASFADPWTEADLIDVLRIRNVIAQVVEVRNANGHWQIVGFFVYECLKHRIKVVSVAVDPAFRRLGVGTKIVAKLKSKLSYAGRTKLTFDVRDTHVATQLWLRANSVRAICVRREWFEDTHEDGIRFEFELEMLQGVEPLEDASDATAAPMIPHNRVARFP